MNRRGINVNKSGNVSVRAARGGADGFLITPTGISYDDLKPEHIVFISLERPFDPERCAQTVKPSSEWEMHAEVYALRADVNAVVHAHSTYATALACRDMPIPSFHYMVAKAGGTSIDVAPYRTFGTRELALAASEALAEKNACLLSHHGVLAAAKNLSGAIDLAAEVENLAKQYVVARSLGEPKLIADDEMARVLERFKTYGQPQLSSSAPAKEEGMREEAASPALWRRCDGSVVACTESVKVLEENRREAQALLQEIFEDAVLLGVGKAQCKEVLHQLVDALECGYAEKRL